MNMCEGMKNPERLLNLRLRARGDRLPFAAERPRLRMARRKALRNGVEGRRFLDDLVELGLTPALTGAGLTLGDVVALRRRDSAFARRWSAADRARLKAVETLLIDHLLKRLAPDAPPDVRELDRALIGLWQQLKAQDEASAGRRSARAKADETPAPADTGASQAADEAELLRLIARAEAAVNGLEADLFPPASNAHHG